MLFALLVFDYNWAGIVRQAPPSRDQALFTSWMLGEWLGLVVLGAALLRLLSRGTLGWSGAVALVLWPELLSSGIGTEWLSPGSLDGPLWTLNRLVLGGVGGVLALALLGLRVIPDRGLPLRGVWLRATLAALGLCGFVYGSAWGGILGFQFLDRSVQAGLPGRCVLLLLVALAAGLLVASARWLVVGRSGRSQGAASGSEEKPIGRDGCGLLKGVEPW